MIYRKNIGGLEQAIRIAAGAAMVVCGLLGLGYNAIGYAVAGMGVVTAVTGLFGFCPGCAMVGRKLNETSTR
jgi:hypothetical protein